MTDASTEAEAAKLHSKAQEEWDIQQAYEEAVVSLFVRLLYDSLTHERNRYRTAYVMFRRGMAFGRGRLRNELIAEENLHALLDWLREYKERGEVPVVAMPTITQWKHVLGTYVEPPGWLGP